MTKRALHNPLGSLDVLEVLGGPVAIFRLDELERQGLCDLARMPYSIRILLEAMLRHCDGEVITTGDVENLAAWDATNFQPHELAFMPARVLLQDFTGVPAVVDLAALRSAMQRLGGDPSLINPVIPADLVIDHSVQVDRFGSDMALAYNAQREFERNRERYEFLRWGQTAFEHFRVVPPATGIVHQVNLEYLAHVVQTSMVNGRRAAFPDTVVGTDSHTTMINGLGVLGWGVGGIEAEAVMLGQPYAMLTPQVVGVRLSGRLPERVTATDLVLTITQLLRAKGVVGKFVEYYGPGLNALGVEDRATIANMSPEYGATMGFFPVDANTLDYMRSTGRPAELVDLVEQYTKEQRLFRTDGAPDPEYSERLALDLGTIEPSLAGPKRPQDRILLKDMKRSFQSGMEKSYNRPAKVTPSLSDGDVVIAAITSCTNTSNPSVMIGAGLLAKKAVERGLHVPARVKTSLAPGSQVVTHYLDALELTPYLQALGFHTVGYGCTTCIGNSGPLPETTASAIKGNDLVVASVLSGNRNFEGRVHPLTRINYLASPPLVVAFALAGTVNINLTTDPIGLDPNGQQVYLKDIWPGQEEIRQAIDKALSAEIFCSKYGQVFQGDDAWNRIQAPEGKVFDWDPESTYIREPPFFCSLTTEVRPVTPIKNARVLALLGDSVTTDHISPAGAIPLTSPAGSYLLGKGIEQNDFNSFGSRRGNHEVMMRGTFGNIRLRNLLLPGSEGGVTLHIPSGETMSIYDAAMRYQEEKTPLIVIGGKEYGTGSSRDWAAKGTILLGVRAVLVESYERIHRSNLIGMGVLPLQFKEGQNAASLGLTGLERYDIENLDEIQPGQELPIRVTTQDGSARLIMAIVRIDSPVEVEYYRNGGVLHAALRSMLRKFNQNGR